MNIPDIIIILIVGLTGIVLLVQAKVESDFDVAEAKGRGYQEGKSFEREAHLHQENYLQKELAICRESHIALAKPTKTKAKRPFKTFRNKKSS